MLAVSEADGKLAGLEDSVNITMVMAVAKRSICSHSRFESMLHR